MRTIYIILFISSCLFCACFETDEYELIRDNLKENAVQLKNPIRFDQLAVGQKSTYVLVKTDSCFMPSCCQQTLDTLRVEIIEQDNNGYLVKETTTLPNHEMPFFFYLKYEIQKVLRDTLENEPSLKEYDELITVKTVPVDEDSYQRSALYNRLGTRLYLYNPPNKSLISTEIENLCEGFFLPIRKEDPLPNRDGAYHSQLGIMKDHSYDNICYGDLLLMNHDYGYVVDAFNFTYGYSLEAGLIFSGSYRGAYLYGDPSVWHIILDN